MNSNLWVILFFLLFTSSETFWVNIFHQYDCHFSLLAASEEQILSLCEECLSKVKHQLPPFNVSHLRVLDCALDAAIRCGMWEQALSYVVVTLQPYKSVLTNEHIYCYTSANKISIIRICYIGPYKNLLIL